MLFGATLHSLAIFQFATEDLFQQSHAVYSGHMANLSELCLHKQGRNAGNIGPSEDCIRDSVLPLDLQQFP